MLSIMGMASLSITLSVWVIHIHHHGSHRPVPRVIRRIFLGGVSRLLCMNQMVSTARDANQLGDKTLKVGEETLAVEVTDHPAVGTHSVLSHDTISREIVSNLTVLKNKVEEDQKTDSVVQEWKNLARVLDRLFFFLIMICLLIEVIARVILPHFIYK